MSRARRKRRRKRRLFVHVPRVRVFATPNAKRVIGQLYVTTNGGRTWVKATTYYFDPAINGRTYSDARRISDQKHPGPPYKCGGPFHKFSYVDDCSDKSSGEYIRMTSSSIGYKYLGAFTSQMKPQSFDGRFTNSNAISEATTGSSMISSLGDISSYGPTGWNKFRPGNPTADLGVFLGELRDLPRMLKGTARFFHERWRNMGGSLTGFSPKSVADHWLNTQFGWLPFIRDLRAFYETAKNLDQRLAQIKRDNGQWIRRRGTVERSTSVAVVNSSLTNTNHSPVLPSYFYLSPSNTGNYSAEIIQSRRVWFSGRFRYWIPDTGAWYWKAKATADLFGLTPSPSLIWNLTPWSWLGDWCSNIGNNIANMSTGYAENLTAKYAYVMGTTTYRCELSSAHYIRGYSNLYDTWTFPIEWKSRVAASPFGFGLSESDFSLRQWSILAALGITRLKL